MLNKDRRIVDGAGNSVDSLVMWKTRTLIYFFIRVNTFLVFKKIV